MPDRRHTDAPPAPPARPETYISVDVETSGPTPGGFAMLAIGACLVDALETTFYVELKPTTTASVPSAMAIGGLSLETLAETGTDPTEAMRQFADWVERVVPPGFIPVFVGFNAVFDWMFVADYFERFLGRNPFGHSAVDIKSYFMGMAGESWAATSLKFLSPRYLDGSKLSHNALGDAQDQARLFAAIRDEATAHN